MSDRMILNRTILTDRHIVSARVSEVFESSPPVVIWTLTYQTGQSVRLYGQGCRIPSRAIKNVMTERTQTYLKENASLYERLYNWWL